MPDKPVVKREITIRIAIYEPTHISYCVHTIFFCPLTWTKSTVKSIESNNNSFTKENPGMPSFSFVKIESTVIKGSKTSKIRNAKSNVYREKVIIRKNT